MLEIPIGKNLEHIILQAAETAHDRIGFASCHTYITGKILSKICDNSIIHNLCWRGRTRGDLNKD